MGILIPFGVLLVMSAILLSVFVVNRLQDRALHEQQVTVRTLFDTEASLHPSLNGLTVLARNRGYERIWILSATGDILASSKESDIGSRLDERWWRRLEGRRSGFNQESVQFGDGTIMLTALHHAEMGRWVVLLSRPRSVLAATSLYLGLILAVSLILWLLLAALIWGTLKRRVTEPLKKLDERSMDVMRGNRLTEATLDRLWAETAPSLGGHADCFVDLARIARKSEEQSLETESRFQQLFDGIPSIAFICSDAGSILAANRVLAQRMSIESRWIEGQPLSMLNGILPVTTLNSWMARKGSDRVAIDHFEIYPSDTEDLTQPISLSVRPIRYKDQLSHLIVAEILQLDPVATPVELACEMSGDGASLEIELPQMRYSERLLEGMMQATGQFAVAFNEEAKTIFWSPAARLITGIDQSDISDMKKFTRKIFATHKEQNVFRAWIDGSPDERSQELIIKTASGKRRARWYASEIDLDGEGSVGVLWATLDSSVKPKSPGRREPVSG